MASDDNPTLFGQPMPKKPKGGEKAAEPDDQDSTLFGTPIPKPGQQPPAPAPAPLPPQAGQPAPPVAPQQHGQAQPFRPQNPQDPRLGGLPPQAQPPQAPAPAPAPPSAAPNFAPQSPQPASDDDTWLGGDPVNTPSGHAYNPPTDHSYPAPISPMRPDPAASFVPEHIRQDTRPSEHMFPSAAQAAQPHAPTVPRIELAAALRSSGIGKSASDNGLIAAASDLLILFGRLRTGLVALEPVQLRDHVLNEIQRFTHRASENGEKPADIERARYALAATADDIVQTIPGVDVSYWQMYSMSAELLQDRAAGTGFFERLQEAMKYPADQYNVLEFMFTCLAVGFEGVYRAEPQGQVQLARLRTEVYQILRNQKKREGEDIAVTWLPVVLNGKRRSGAIPIWLVGSIAAGMVLALFSTLYWFLSSSSASVQEDILAMHFVDSQIQRDLGETTAPAVSSQIERIRAALSTELDAGDIVLDEKGDFLLLRVGPLLKFAPGQATLATSFEEMAVKLGTLLNSERGPIRIEGHTDSIKPGASARYKTNEALSQARADTVVSILTPVLTESDRMKAVGAGASEPIASNKTREGRALNRRVEILLLKENKL